MYILKVGLKNRGKRKDCSIMMDIVPPVIRGGERTEERRQKEGLKQTCRRTD